jgi:hypothetical protein
MNRAVHIREALSNYVIISIANIIVEYEMDEQKYIYFLNTYMHQHRKFMYASHQIFYRIHFGSTDGIMKMHILIHKDPGKGSVDAIIDCDAIWNFICGAPIRGIHDLKWSGYVDPNAIGYLRFMIARDLDCSNEKVDKLGSLAKLRKNRDKN